MPNVKRYSLPDPSFLTYVRLTCLSPLFKSGAFLPHHLRGWGNISLSPRIPQKCWNNYSALNHPLTGNFQCFINISHNSWISYNVWSLWSICFRRTGTCWWSLLNKMIEQINDSSSDIFQTPRFLVPHARYWAGCSTQAVTRSPVSQ